MIELWKTEYPTLATVNEAALMTLDEWDKYLPAPETDVQRTIRRRIKAKMWERAEESVREHDPAAADELKALMDILGANGLMDFSTEFGEWGK